jgi:hypothetical protein
LLEKGWVGTVRSKTISSGENDPNRPDLANRIGCQQSHLEPTSRLKLRNNLEDQPFIAQALDVSYDGKLSENNMHANMSHPES